MDEKLLDATNWGNQIAKLLVIIKNALLAALPHFFTLIFILILGWIAARVGYFLSYKLCQYCFRLVPHFEDNIVLKNMYDRQTLSKALGIIIYWIILLYFIFLAIKTLAIPGLSEQLARLVEWMPLLASAVGISFLGYVLGTVAKEIIASSIRKKSGKDVHLFAEIIRFSIIFIFVIWSVGIIGIDISMLKSVIDILLAAIFGSIALGFGLGSSSHVANMIASYQLKKQFQVGETIQINETVGTIVDITRTALILESKDGTVVIPSKLINDIISIKK